MKFDFGLLLLCSIILLLESCSESNKVSGGTIEDQNALLEKQVNDWYNYGMDLNKKRELTVYILARLTAFVILILKLLIKLQVLFPTTWAVVCSPYKAPIIQ